MDANHYWFDWIFFAIVGIPWVLALVQLVSPDWLEPLIAGQRSGLGSGEIRKH